MGGILEYIVSMGVSVGLMKKSWNGLVMDQPRKVSVEMELV